MSVTASMLVECLQQRLSGPKSCNIYYPALHRKVTTQWYSVLPLKATSGQGYLLVHPSHTVQAVTGCVCKRSEAVLDLMWRIFPPLPGEM